MHAGQHTRGIDCEFFRQFMDTPGLGEVVQRAAHLFTGIKDIFAGERFMLVPTLGEEVAAEERFGRILEKVATFPGVRQVRSIDPSDNMDPQ